MDCCWDDFEFSHLYEEGGETFLGAFAGTNDVLLV